MVCWGGGAPGWQGTAAQRGAGPFPASPAAAAPAEEHEAGQQAGALALTPPNTRAHTPYDHVWTPR